MVISQKVVSTILVEIELRCQSYRPGQAASDDPLTGALEGFLGKILQDVKRS